MKKFVIVALAATLSFGTLPSLAHHSGSMFDRNKEVTLTGVVQEFQYTNPHSWLVVDVTNDDGTITTWGFEAEGPSSLLRAGIRKSDFAPGTKLTITANPMRDGRSAGYWIRAVRAKDGKVFTPGSGFEVK